MSRPKRGTRIEMPNLSIYTEAWLVTEIAAASAKTSEYQQSGLDGAARAQTIRQNNAESELARRQTHRQKPAGG